MTDQRPWTTRITTDHDEIREWVEARDARPTRGEGDDLESLRIDFPDEESEGALDPVSWEEFFETFEQNDLAFRYIREEQNSERSDRDRFVRREATGVPEGPDGAVTVVAVATATDEPEPSGGGDERNSEEADRSELDSRPETDPARGPTAVGVPDEVLGNRRPQRRRLTAGLVVDEIHENAAGYDEWNENDEYVVLRNESDDSLDLTGWTVENADGTTYEFPEGFALDSGRSVTVHSGSGEDTDRHLYWGAERALWKNTSDVLTVRDAAGKRVIRVSY